MQPDVARRRLVLAAMLGTGLDWYDFILYGTASALVFNKTFFSAASPATGTLAAFATFAAGFGLRPVGGLVFGHLGDRLGRKNTLVVSLVLMGTSSTLIGALPSYASIGIWAPCLLVALRMVQGFGAGAEYAGAGTLAVEWSSVGRRGLFGSIPGAGAAIGSLLSSVIFFVVTRSLSEHAFVSWGWRVPFLLSVVLLAVAFYARRRMGESPEFTRAKHDTVKRVPIVDLLRGAPRETALGVLASVAPNVGVYVPTVFGISYMTMHLHIDRDVVVAALVVAYLVGLPVSVVSGGLSDRLGRRPIFLAGALFTAASMMPFFWLVGTRDTGLILLAFVLTVSLGFYTMVGAQGSLLAELFPTRARWTGVAVSREVAAAVAGGTAPLVASALLNLGGRIWPIAAYASALSLISAGAVILLPERAHVALASVERPAAPGERAVSEEGLSVGTPVAARAHEPL